MKELEGLIEWLQGVHNLSNVARASGVGLATVLAIKKGDANPTARTIAALLEVKRTRPPVRPVGW